MRGEAIEEDTVLLDEEAYLNIPTCGKGSQKEVQEDVERVEHGITLKVHNPGIDKAQTIVTTPGTVVQIVPFGGDGRATAGGSPRRSGGLGTGLNALFFPCSGESIPCSVVQGIGVLKRP